MAIEISDRQKRARSAHEKVKAANAARAKAVPKQPDAVVATGVEVSGSNAVEDRARSAKSSARWDQRRAAADMKKATSGKMTASQRRAISSAFTTSLTETGKTGREKVAREFARDNMTAAERGTLTDTQKRTSLVERFGEAKDSLARDKFKLQAREAGYGTRTDEAGEQIATRYGVDVDPRYSALGDFGEDADPETVFEAFSNADDPEAALPHLSPYWRGQISAQRKKLQEGVTDTTTTPASGKRFTRKTDTSYVDIPMPEAGTVPTGEQQRTSRLATASFGTSTRTKKVVSEVARSFRETQEQQVRQLTPQPGQKISLPGPLEYLRSGFPGTGISPAWDPTTRTFK